MVRASLFPSPCWYVVIGGCEEEQTKNPFVCFFFSKISQILFFFLSSGTFVSCKTVGSS